MKNSFYSGLARYFTAEELNKLVGAKVGIAGAGGLGSNVALMLARSGIGNFVLVDYDKVDWSNLNRQQYWPCHVGMPKATALAKILRELNSAIKIDVQNVMLDKNNLAAILTKSAIWVEALDRAETKAMFISGTGAVAAHVAGACGICGIGGADLKRKKIGRIFLAGDFVSGLEQKNPYAPRVTQAAAMMADDVLEYILKH